ncbi:MAG: hypothetical protein KAT35_04470, partial [Candidatus Aenigmarchaeota archaeon]|nr:hypothetical protein [Candidatus Aenigmarchaeota archaeon]
VILVTAVVVLAIFFPAVNLASNLTQAKVLCQTEYTTSCATFDQKPPTWNIQNKDVKQGETTRKMSCEQILHENKISCDCDNKVLKCTDSGSGTQDRPFGVGPGT